MIKSLFIPNHTYKRSVIHDQYGGNRQGGISPSAKHPYIFIFSGKTGLKYGYKDEWDNSKIFSYTGEGQVGDMSFTKGNLALKDHLNTNKRVFLFEYVMKGYVKFITELVFYDADYFEAPDINMQPRKAIKFFFTKIGAHIPISPTEFNLSLASEDFSEYSSYKAPTLTERQGLITSRVGQGAYRKRIIHRWEYKCAVSGFSKLDVLIASHIVPWAKSTNEERLDVHNGILLAPHFDALFDKHFITFDRKGKIQLSDYIETNAFKIIGIDGSEFIKNLSGENLIYLEKHREEFAIRHSMFSGEK